MTKTFNGIMRYYMNILLENDREPLITDDESGITLYKFQRSDNPDILILDVRIKPKDAKLEMSFGDLTYNKETKKLTFNKGGEDNKPEILPIPDDNSPESILDSFKQWYEKNENL